MNEIKYLADQITSRYGYIKRARGPFLYTSKNVRLTDLYQEGGRAILGWGGDSAFTMLKNILNRGITGSFNTDGFYRLQKAVSELFNSKRKIYVYNRKEIALSVSPSCVHYVPWLNNQNVKWEDTDVIYFEPTLPWVGDYFIIAVREDLCNQDFEAKAEEKAVVVSPPLQAALTRSIYNLIAALQEREEKQWFIYDSVITKYWNRKGPYLFPKVPEEKYNEFVLYCLDKGVVISPVYEIPSIVPFGADKGIFGSLKREPFNF